VSGPTPATASGRGDLVIALGPDGPPSARRGTWARAAGGDAWTAWRSTPAAGWNGYLVEPVPVDGWDAWFVGEATSTSGPAAAARVLAATAAGDDAAAAAVCAGLHGSWLLLARSADGTGHAWTDRFGTIHGFVARHGSTVAVGTSHHAVASVVGAGELDWEALTVWCALGFFPGDRTGDERVRVIRPATHLVVPADGGAVRSTRYWWWAPELDDRRSVTATVTALDEVLAEVLGEQAAGLRLAVPISGGLDSRTTLAVLTAHEGRARGGELWGYSYGYEAGSIEPRIASRLAAARDLPFVPWTIQPYLLAALDRAELVLEGAQDLTQTRQLGVVDRVAARSDRVIAAHWGDVWLDDMGVGHGDQPGDAVLAKVQSKFTKPGGRWLLDHLCRAHVIDPDRVVADALREEFESYRAVPGDDARARAFKTDQWSFRWTVPSLRAFHAGLTPRLPFYDGRVADLLTTVPPGMLAGRFLQAEHLRRTAPDLARVLWQQSGTNLNQIGWDRTWLLPARVARGGARRVRRKVLGTQVLSRNWEVQFGGGDGRQALRDALLGPRSVLRELVPPAAVEQLLGDLAARPHEAGLGYAASMLLTLGSWAERR
jgi:hypothetical protein